MSSGLADLQASFGGLARKSELYEQDVEFLRARALWMRGCDGDPLRSLNAYTLLTIKAEGVVAHKVGAAERWLGDNGFIVVAALPVRLTADRQMAIWRYQWNVATLDRLNLSRKIGEAGPALLLVLKDDHRVAGATAAQRLSDLKGAVRGDGPPAGSLRAALGFQHKLFGLVHASDSPADVLRELAILLNEADLSSVLRIIRSQSVPDVSVAAVAREISPDAPHLLDSSASRRQLERWRMRGVGPDLASLGQDLSCGVLPPGGLDWGLIDRGVREDLSPFDAWDLFVAIAQLIQFSEPGRSPVLQSVSTPTLAGHVHA